jgi:hypothetical protein
VWCQRDKTLTFVVARCVEEREMPANRTKNRTKTKSMAKAKLASQSKNHPGAVSKTPSHIKPESRDWYLNASQAIAIGRGGDNRGGYHWLRQIHPRQGQH